MNFYDPIPDFVHLGYTQREAAFLYLVGVGSGYFLARQYARFLQRKPGALIQQFLNKAMVRGDVDALDYRQRRVVYHLKSRTIYRLLGDEESQNRRAKGDQQIKTNLMILDYVLDHIGEQFACSPTIKRQFLRELVTVANITELPVSLDRFPLFVSRDSASESRLRFTYFDHGTATIKPFIRNLCSQRALFDHLGQFELAYVAQSARNQSAAEAVFNRLFPKSEIASDLLPFGRDHLLRFLEAEARWNRNDPGFTQDDLKVLREGEHAYVLDEHRTLRKSWHAGQAEFEAQVTTICGAKRTQGRLNFYILRESYPIFANTYTGKPVAANSEAVLGEISASRSIAS